MRQPLFVSEFLALSFEFTRDTELFESLILRDLPVPAFDAFRLVRTAKAVITSIDCFFPNISGSSPALFCAAVFKLAAVNAGVEVAFEIIRHVLFAADVFLVLTRLGNLVICRFDHSCHSSVFQEAVILLTLIPCISYNNRISVSKR